MGSEEGSPVEKHEAPHNGEEVVPASGKALAEGKGKGEEEPEAHATEAPQAVPQLTIDPTKDLWQNIALNAKESNVSQAEVNMFVVGAPSSGKSSVINRICSSIGGSGATSKGKTKLKPTTALDYTYTTRVNRHVSQVVHFWELAQGMELSQLCEVVLIPENVHTMFVMIVVDLGDPSTIWETLAYWLKRTDRRVNEIAQKMRAKGSTTPDKLQARARLALGEGHPDVNRIRFSGLPTVIVCNKLDAFAGDTSQLKTLTRCLRFIAHLYGAYLVFTSEAESGKLRLLLNHMLFLTPFDAKQIEFDADRGVVLVTPESDTFVDIGDPPVCDMSTASRSTGDSELDRWKVPLDAMFPPKNSEDQLQNDPLLKRLYDMGDGGFGEPLIDTVRKQKDEELEQYRKGAAKRDKGEK
ncbi:putative Dynein light intermediate chain (DLIC) [Trypanosoma vivax]|uniref:Cytoplasmic dynein 2 light intermediate chain 1 n=1 Tax=Trypanosoma vivax (strain Y486) TaxID=1055687 RepID=G0U9L2_TRYVY|nr:putative dynein light intermediate chain [Trypanosoma vivax]KAH8604925.1 putative Dynein light intermediate chain (DLIC) [Trypanosoma vivax]CCC54298.1 putative dynein light intermediate chain [Trypanosoma vivax Y486]